MVHRETLARFADQPDDISKPPTGKQFDMEGYLSRHKFAVHRRKDWSVHPGGLLFELKECPFDPDHKHGSSAFTLVDGCPGFRCQHDGCRNKSIKEVFEQYPAPKSGSGRSRRAKGDRSAPSQKAEKRASGQSSALAELATTIELFRTPGGEVYERFPVADHFEVFSLKSTACKSWLTRAYFHAFGKPPSSHATQEALGLLQANAQFDSPQAEVFTRFAPYGRDRIYVDLGSRDWSAVEITLTGWSVVKTHPVRFRRQRSMLSLPVPQLGGSIDTLRRFINVGCDRNWILLASWLVAACRPTGPYPILILQGEQGSAKSTAAKLLRRLIDPVMALVRSTPRDERDLLIAANNAWIIAFDNLSGIQPWLSDALCRLCTGGGFATRELYSDSDEIIFDLARPVILNGIEHLAERPDLAERSIIVNLPRIDEAARQDEAELYSGFEEELPRMLGALFSAVSVAMANQHLVKLERKPRMADFAVWATAAEAGLHFERGAFMAAYSGNRADAVQETLDSDPVASALLEFVHSTDGPFEWTGISNELLEELNRVNAAITRTPTWPKTPKGLSSRLRRMATFLRETGIDVTFPNSQTKTTGGRRVLTIRRIAAGNTATTATSAAGLLRQKRNQQLSDLAASGDGNSQVASAPDPPQEPPLMPQATVARESGSTADSGVSKGKSALRIDHCVTCGPTDWRWEARAWICSQCGLPARTTVRVDSIDSTATEERLMCGTEATE